jgi:hypothetical protein
MEFAEIPASDPLVSLHPDDTRAAAIPAGNGIPADAVDEARKECEKRQLLRETGNGVTPEELRSSKRRKRIVKIRDGAVQFEAALPLFNGHAAFLQAVTEALATHQEAYIALINANHTALIDTVNGHTASINALTYNQAALTGTVNAMATYTFRAINNEKVRHQSQPQQCCVLSPYRI